MKLKCILLYFIVPCTAYRILAIYPSPSISHQIVFRPVVKSLVEKGYQMTIITSLPFELNDGKNDGNVTQIDISELKYVWNEVYNAQTNHLGVIQYTMKAIDASIKMMELLFNNTDVVRLMNDEENHFDAVIVEYLGMYATYAFGHKYKIPLIGIASFDEIDHRGLGNEWHPIHHVHNSARLCGDFGYVGRLYSFFAFLVADLLIMPYVNWRNNKLIDDYFGPQYPRAKSLSHSLDLVIVDAPNELGFVRPTLPNTIQLGFMHIQTPKPLPVGLQTYLNNSKHGVIYFSLGSNVKASQIGIECIEMFIEAFRALKYDIIWKWEEKELNNRSNNVKIVDWLPQQDLLSHPQVKLFIMQGGQQSLEEAIYHSIPLLVIPFFGDQKVNAYRVQKLGIGKTMQLKDLSKQLLIENIHELIQNSTNVCSVIELNCRESEQYNGMDEVNLVLQNVCRIEST